MSNMSGLRRKGDSHVEYSLALRFTRWRQCKYLRPTIFSFSFQVVWLQHSLFFFEAPEPQIACLVLSRQSLHSYESFHLIVWSKIAECTLLQFSALEAESQSCVASTLSQTKHKEPQWFKEFYDKSKMLCFPCWLDTSKPLSNKVQKYLQNGLICFDSLEDFKHFWTIVTIGCPSPCRNKMPKERPQIPLNPCLSWRD